jgi:hypothetical protein
MNERIDSIERLRRFAERALDPSTYERVILPAIADLRHECDEHASSVVRVRAHWSVWKALVLCLAIDSVRVGRPTLHGVAKRIAIIFPIVSCLLFLPSLDAMVRSPLPFARELLWSSPQALSPGLALAYFVALLLEPATVPPRRLIPMVFAMSLVCTTVLSAMTMSVIPRSNVAYRNAVFERLKDPSSADQRRPSLGPAEWTFTELVRKSVRGSSNDEVQRARRTLNMRLIVSTLPIMLGFMGLALSGAPSPKVALFNALWLVILYIAVAGAFAPSKTSGPSASSIWLINGVFTLAGFCLAFRRPGAIGADRAHLPSP